MKFLLLLRYWCCADMVNRNVAMDKSKRFAIRIVNMYKYLSSEKNEYILSKQALRSGTSIGANIAEAECAISRNDFLSKLYIALKECNETSYWLELLHETDYLDDDMFESIFNDCQELKRILSASTKTMKTRFP